MREARMLGPSVPRTLVGSPAHQLLLCVVVVVEVGSVHLLGCKRGEIPILFVADALGISKQATSSDLAF